MSDFNVLLHWGRFLLLLLKIVFKLNIDIEIAIKQNDEIHSLSEKNNTIITHLNL